MKFNEINKIPNRYRPIPFWSWNENLNIEETKRQVEIMADIGLGGFFMHARGGLQTEYMGEEWFDNVSTAIDSALEYGMTAWAYDENGWPSGFGNGKVTALGIEYQQKYLRMENGERQTDKTIYNGNGRHFFYETNPFYVDNLNANVVRCFIESIHEAYYKKVGSDLEGIFTDEPEISEKGIPWSFVLPQKYNEEYGEDLLPVLEELFIETGNYKETRKKFWYLVTKLFSESYFKQIYNWCDERGLKLTGHLVNETKLRSQITTNGACMPHYEYFHVPGIDWLGREPREQLVPLQAASVAAQMGKKQVLTESFALCGHGVSFSELRRILEWQMVRGVSLLCQHLQSYSLRGIRKRDYPPPMYYQQPWWGDEYRTFIDAVSRIGMLIAEGKSACSTLLIHPQTSAWICYNTNENHGLMELDQAFEETITLLERKHIQFHLGDEILMERHGYVKENKIVIGEMEYDTIVLLPECIDFLDSTKRILNEYKSNGGIVITADLIKENIVTDNQKITYLKRCFDDFDMHYFVNSTDKYQRAFINVDGQKMDSLTGEMQSFSKDYVFSPMDSLVVIDDKSKEITTFSSRKQQMLDVSGDWNLVCVEDNVLTLDFCDCYFDEKFIGTNMAVMAIQEMACDLKAPVNIKCIYNFDVNEVPENLYLVCETPHNYTFKINNVPYNFEDCGYFKDTSFRKSDIVSYIHKGRNIIELNTNFSQSEQTYQNWELSRQHATIRNKFTYDMEIEPIYITGNFGIKTDGAFTSLDLNAVRYHGDMAIDCLPKQVNLNHLEQQRFPFFAGRMTVHKDFILKNTDYKLNLHLRGLNGVQIKINGETVGIYIWDDTEIDISPYLSVGKNIIELSIVNNLRNMLGPHHLEEGECHSVRPFSFIPGKSIWHWSSDSRTPWNDDYCFLEMSVY